MTEPTTPAELRKDFSAIYRDAEEFFNSAIDQCNDENQRTLFFGEENPDRFWNCLGEESQLKAENLIDRILVASANLTKISKKSALVGEEDILAIKMATKYIRASLHLRCYTYHKSEAIHDEGVVLGFRHAEQSDNEAASPITARRVFIEKMGDIYDAHQLIQAGENDEITSSTTLADQSNNYRTGTAFIMMWMDPNQPELNDVADTVKSIFKKFGVRAVRADDIEHESLVTERILNEIKSSEFLFADLTGMRPNVYYEVGYAHALNKRVILFRKSGTSLHFDLAGYNCPDYQNLRDLRQKLTRRLEHLTNKRPLDQQDLNLSIS